MDKNVVFAIIFSTLIIITGVTIQTKFFPSAPAQNTAAVAEKALPAPVAESNTAIIPEKDTAITEAAAETTDTKTVETAAIPEQTDVIETPLVRVEFTNRGGDIVSYKLKQHAAKDDSVEMADHVTAANRAFSIIFGDANGAPIDQTFNVKRISDTEIGFYRTFSIKNADGTTSSFTLAKQYSFKPDDYMFELRVTVDGDSSFTGLNLGHSAYTIKTSPQIGPKWAAKNDQYEYRKYYSLLDGKKKVVTVNQGQKKAGSEKISWTGITGKYFSLIAIPESPLSAVQYSAQSPDPDLTIDQIFLSRAPITGKRTTDVWKIYIGPRTDKALGAYNVATNNPYKLSDTKLD